MKFKEGSTKDSKDFIKLGDQDTVVGVCAGEIHEYKQHWSGSAPELCPEDQTCRLCHEGGKSAFRFRVNFIIKEGEGLVAKILEQGWTLYCDLRELNKEYELDKHFIKITRKGKGKNDTSYSVVPVKNGALPIEKLELVSKIQLHDLTISDHKKEAVSQEQPPKFNDGEELPF